MESTALDEQIQRSIWDAAVPIELKLSEDDLATPVPPDPYYLLAPRIGYLPTVTSIAESYFMEYVASRFDGMWFKSKDIPLKWNLPIGVLYDLYGEGKLPWCIEVNFQGFPADKLQRWESEEALKSHFMNNLKEANHMKDRNNTAINSLTRDDQIELWEAIKKQEYKKFWRIYPKLGRSVDEIKFLPIRLVSENGVTMMSPITSRQSNGELTLLRDVLKANPQFDDSYQPLIHGISAPLDSPVSYLAYHCAHPDNFLYIVLVKREST